MEPWVPQFDSKIRWCPPYLLVAQADQTLLACGSKFINQPIATVVSSKPQCCRDNSCDMLISRFGLTRIPQMPLVEHFATIMFGKLALQLKNPFLAKFWKD